MVIEETVKLAQGWSIGGNREGHGNLWTTNMTAIPLGALRNQNSMELEQREG